MGDRYVLGVDIGGTKLIIGAVREDGADLVGTESTWTQAERGADDILERLAAQIRRVADALVRERPGAELIGMGVGAPGALDRAKGLVYLAPNLGWRDMPLGARLREIVDVPVALENDANCAVLGECWIGAAQGVRHAIGLTIGTGVGGGIVCDGRLYHGASDCAGEIGHITIDTEGRRCGCGNYGCLEAYASGTAIALRAAEQIESGADSSLADRVEGNLRAITAQMVYEAAEAGDALALEVVTETARFLGAGVASLLNIFNPEAVVIVGGVTRAGPRLFVPLEREVRRRAFKPAVAACRIVPGRLLGTAGVWGAAKAFLDQQTHA
jgi:glucokinase